MKRVELGTLFEFIRNGASIKQSELATGYPITRIETIWNLTIDTSRLGYANINDDSYSKYYLDKGDILMSHINSPKHLGKCAIYNGNPEVLIHGMNLLCLRPIRTKVNSKYLFYYLNSIYFKLKLNKISNQSVNQASFTVTNLKKIKIPVPSLKEQEKIANILGKSENLKIKDKKIVDQYDSLMQSIFMDMFGTPSNNSHNFELGTVKDLVSSVNYGTSAKADIDGEYSYLRMNNITYQGYMDYQDLKYINLSKNDKPKYLVKKGDILFNRTNSKELVGKTGLYNEEHAMAIAGYLIRVRVNQKANPYYLWRFMNSSHCKSVLSHMCKSIVGMANINAQELQKIQILLPPIELQNKFAYRIKEIEKQKEIAQQSLKKSEELFNSLLQQAFKGELTQTESAN
ncbi:restriction endonuclease subunit S [Vibrio owensii]|uniref:restriction endonuclease subunit S n=1 Tax=Vibrio owensii TaxID=696485 RepID=UPI003909B083